MNRLKALAWESWLPIVLVAAWLVASAGSTSFYFPPLADILDRVVEVWFFDGRTGNAAPSTTRTRPVPDNRPYRSS